MICPLCGVEISKESTSRSCKKCSKIIGCVSCLSPGTLDYHYCGECNPKKRSEDFGIILPEFEIRLKEFIKSDYMNEFMEDKGIGEELDNLKKNDPGKFYELTRSLGTKSTKDTGTDEVLRKYFEKQVRTEYKEAIPIIKRANEFFVNGEFNDAANDYKKLTGMYLLPDDLSFYESMLYISQHKYPEQMLTVFVANIAEDVDDDIRKVNNEVILRLLLNYTKRNKNKEKLKNKENQIVRNLEILINSIISYPGNINDLRKLIDENYYNMVLNLDDQLKAEAYICLARYNTLSDNYDTAKRLYTTSADIFLKHNEMAGVMDAYFGIGECLMHNKKYKDAILWFERSLEIHNNNYKDNNNPGLNFYLGSCYMEIEKYSDGIKFLDYAGKEFQEAGNILGEILTYEAIKRGYSEAGDSKNATRYQKRIEKIYTKTLDNFTGEEPPNQQEPLNQLIMMLYLSQITEKIKKDPGFMDNSFKKLVESDPGRIEESIREIISNHSGDLSYRVFFGVFLRVAGRLDDAEKEYRDILKSDPGHVNAHYHLANILEEQKRFEEAREEYKIISEFRPDDIEVKQQIKRIDNMQYM